MDDEILAANIIEAAKRSREEREAREKKAKEEEARANDFHAQRHLVYTVLAQGQSDRIEEAANALIEIGNSLNPYGADFWADEHLDAASKVDSWPHRHFAFLLVRRAFFDQDLEKLTRLLQRAITTPELDGVGQYLCSDLLEFYWARSRYEDALANGQPNLEAVPFTTTFRNVGELAKALKDLPGFSRETINRRLKNGELITSPTWTKNSTAPHKFKFCDPATQRKVLAHLRSQRTVGTMLQPSRGSDVPIEKLLDDKTVDGR